MAGRASPVPGYLKGTKSSMSNCAKSSPQRPHRWSAATRLSMTQSSRSSADWILAIRALSSCRQKRGRRYRSSTMSCKRSQMINPKPRSWYSKRWLSRWIIRKKLMQATFRRKAQQEMNIQGKNLIRRGIWFSRQQWSRRRFIIWARSREASANWMANMLRMCIESQPKLWELI